MRYLAQFNLSAIMFLSLVTTPAIGQDFSRPDGVESSNIAISPNSYTPSNGTLLLPSVRILPNGSSNSSEEVLLSVEMRHRGGNDLEVVQTTGVEGSTECTTEEVANAIPQLSLDHSLGELSTLIGCASTFMNGAVDFESGKLVHANWVGYNGIPQSWIGPPHYLHSGVVDSFPQTDYIPYNFVLSGTAATRPTITVSFREGIPESYTVHNGDSGAECAEDLSGVFDNLTIGDSVADIVSITDCDGDHLLTTVTASVEKSQYQWRRYTTQPNQILQTISVSFQNDQATMINFSSESSAVSTGVACPIEDFNQVLEAIQIGDPVNDPVALFNCGWRTDYFSSSGGQEKTVYVWVNVKPVIGFLTSFNRKLSVEVKEGVVTDVVLSRF